MERKMRIRKKKKYEVTPHPYMCCDYIEGLIHQILYVDPNRKFTTDSECRGGWYRGSEFLTDGDISTQYIGSKYDDYPERSVGNLCAHSYEKVIVSGATWLLEREQQGSFNPTIILMTKTPRKVLPSIVQAMEKAGWIGGETPEI